ncbi:hypothetical protein HDZ31DRAFT_59647 [Schizophyllum fasciatum]
MATIPDRQTLMDMKRPELQRLCKEHQLRANLSNVDLIASLIHYIDNDRRVLVCLHAAFAHDASHRDGAESDGQASSPDTAPPTPAPATIPLQRTSSRRTVSRASSRSMSSVVDNSTGKPQSNVENHQPELPPVPSPTRAAKAKQQTRLGVGRPKAAGGAGARAVTKAFSTSRRGKGASRTVKPTTEATIPEEPAIESPVPQSNFEFRFDMVNGAGPSGTQQTAESSSQDATATSSALFSQPSQDSQGWAELLSSQQATDLFQSMDPQPAISAATQPIQEQLQALQTEMFSIRSTYAAEVAALKGQLAQAQDTITTLKTQVEELKPQVMKIRGDAAISVAHNGQLHAHAFDIQQLKDKVAILSRALPSAGSSRPASPGGSVRAISPAQRALAQQSASSSPGRRARMDSQTPPAPAAGPSTLPSDHPGFAPNALGKRHRDSAASSVTDVLEQSQASELTQEQLSEQAVRPDRKRARTMPDSEDASADENLPNDDSIVAPAPAQHQPFTIYRDPHPGQQNSEEEEEYFDQNAPPTASLESLFPMTAQDAAREAFAVLDPEDLPVPPQVTPANAPLPQYSNRSYFPMPETPVSPTPGNEDTAQGYFGGSHGGGSERQQDMYSMFGLPSPTRPTLRTPAAVRRMSGQMADPAALLRKGDGEGSGIPTLAELMETSPPSPTDPAARTMYGTEIENNTRFADFGMSHIVTSSRGFWEPSGL